MLNLIQNSVKPVYRGLSTGRQNPKNRKLEIQLAWRDSFRTFNWIKALPVPELVLSQVRQLLALI